MNKLEEFYRSLPNGRCKPCKYNKVVVATNNYMFLGCYCNPYKGKAVFEIEKCPNRKEGGKE